MADRGNKRVQVFTTAGAFKHQLAIGADTAAKGNLYTAELRTKRVQKFVRK